VPDARLHDIYYAEQQITKALPKSGLFAKFTFVPFATEPFFSVSLDPSGGLQRGSQGEVTWKT